ncbi:hypothetical protein Bpfe_020373, partial [Biomphalaria pfeifferi]
NNWIDTNDVKPLTCRKVSVIPQRRKASATHRTKHTHSHDLNDHHSQQLHPKALHPCGMSAT